MGGSVSNGTGVGENGGMMAGAVSICSVSADIVEVDGPGTSIGATVDTDARSSPSWKSLLGLHSCMHTVTILA